MNKKLETVKAKRAEIDKALSAVESAIADKQKIIAASVPDESRLKAAKMAVEDALAVHACGGKAVNLAALRADLDAATADFQASAAGLKIAADEAAVALAGLIRRQETLQSEMGDTGHEYREAVQAELEAERDSLLKRYVQAANEIAETYSGAMALARFASRLNHNLGPLWRSVLTPSMPAPLVPDSEMTGHVSGDPSCCFTPVSLAGLIDRAEPVYAEKFGELLN